MSEDTRPRDVIRLLVEMLRFHEDETMAIDQLAEETGLEWGEVYNYILLIEDVLALAPDVEFLGKGEVAVGRPHHETPELFESEAMEVLSYVFARTKAARPLVVADHPYLADREAGIETAVETGRIERDNGTVALTPQGAGEIGPLYSRVVNGRV